MVVVVVMEEKVVQSRLSCRLLFLEEFSSGGQCKVSVTATKGRLSRHLRLTADNS